ncbi:MAG: helix-turn-helix domain-containing protein [Acidimicrobiales bacterium]
MRRQLEELGLNGYEARVLIALVQMGPAGASELARSAGIERTNVYPVMSALVERGLAVHLPSKVTRWSSAGPNEVLDLLYATYEERLKSLRSSMDETRHALTSMATAATGVAPPHLHFVRGTAQARAAYEDLLARAEHEVLMFTRPPYVGLLGRPNPAVLDALGRGVHIRVLYEGPGLDQPGSGTFKDEIEGYHHAGVEARVVEHLPIKLMVADLTVALVAMPDSAGTDAGHPTNVLIEHRGYAETHALAFERLWERAEPFEPQRVRAAPATEGGMRGATATIDRIEAQDQAEAPDGQAR